MAKALVPPSSLSFSRSSSPSFLLLPPLGQGHFPTLLS